MSRLPRAMAWTLAWLAALAVVTMAQMRIEPAGLYPWRVGSADELVVASDNTADIGQNGDLRPQDVYFAGRLAINRRAAVTVDAATTFAIASSQTALACTGAESINTITGGAAGTLLMLEHTDTDCTLVDDDDPTAADAIDLTGTATNDVGAVKKFVVLAWVSGSWVQLSESDN